MLGSLSSHRHLGNSRRAAAAWLAASLIASPSAAQIIIPVTSPEHTIITAKLTAPEGRTIRCLWSVAPALSYVDGKAEHSLNLTGAPGEYVIEATTVSWEPGNVESTLDFGRYREAFKITGSKPEPDPAPPTPTPTPPTPTPVPPGPVPPQPAPEPRPGTLAALVPPNAREPLSEFYADWARVIRSGACPTTGEFRAAHIESMKATQDVLNASGWSAINTPISERIAGAVGLSDVTLSVTLRSALAAALDAISAEFR